MSTEMTAEQHHRTTTIIVAAMIMGVLLAAGVAWWTQTNQETVREPILITHPLVLAWLLVAGGSVFGASYFRSSIVGSAARPGLGATSPKNSPAARQGRIIIMWALIEGACLMGLVIYFVYGVTQLFSAVLGYILVAAFIFFPRRSWFGLT